GQYARILAENYVRVLVPTLIDRRDEYSGNPRLGRMTNQPHREFVYRMAYEMGRHIIGYEVQKVLAAVDWFARTSPGLKIDLWVYGEGGLIAMCSGACDQRIFSTLVSGHFYPREGVWREPIYRNIWGFLREFGDAELFLLAGSPSVPRPIFVEFHPGPEVPG